MNMMNFLANIFLFIIFFAINFTIFHFIVPEHATTVSIISSIADWFILIAGAMFGAMLQRDGKL